MLAPRHLFALGALLGILSLTGCGSEASPARQTSAQISAGLSGSPAPLARLHASRNQLLGGGTSAFRAQLAALRGYPVVVNKWASWCAPCRAEFPFFQVVGAKLGHRVAFLGLNGKGDQAGSARSFLGGYPVTYPSYLDEDEAIARTIGAATYDPITVYLDRAGRVQYVHAGAYPDAASLERDVRRYAIG